MTVYGLEYRPKSYRPTGPLRRLQPLVRSEFRAMFHGRWTIMLYAACFLPAFVRMVIMLGWIGLLPFAGGARERLDEAPDMVRMWIPLAREFYVELVVHAPNGVFFFVIVLTALATARAIAKDRATNALELYWTRGISPFGYFVGKWFGAFLLLATLTVVAPTVIWLVGALLADDWTFWESTSGFVPRVLLAQVVFTFVLSLLCVLVSAVAGSANVATILWCLMLGGSLALSLFLSQMMREDLRATVSIWDAAGTLARAIAGMKTSPRDLEGAAWTLSGLTAVLVLLVKRRLRISEALG